MEFFTVEKEHDFLGFGPYFVVSNSDNDSVLLHADEELCKRFAKQLNEEQKKIPFTAYVLDSEYQKFGVLFLAGIASYQVSSLTIEGVYAMINKYALEKKREVIFKQIK